MARHAPPSRFITLFFAAYDPARGLLSYVTPGTCHRSSGARPPRLTSTAVALGIFENSVFTAESTVLDPGDLLVLHSGRITEAENPDVQPFEESGLERLLSNLSDADLGATGQKIFAAVERHAQDTRFADDLTVLPVKRSFQVSAAGV